MNKLEALEIMCATAIDCDNNLTIRQNEALASTQVMVARLRNPEPEPEPETREYAFETASGHKIIAQMDAEATGAGTRAGRIILAHAWHKHEYVTAWLGDGDAGWHAGRYFDTHAEALADFAARCKHN